MKVLAIHDAKGDIARIVVCPPNSPPAGTAVGAGYLATEVEAPDLKINAADPQSYQRVAQVLKKLKVEVKPAGKLVKKRPSGAR